MEINLREGEEIKIKAKEGTSEAYMIVVCFQDCILKKSEMIAINPQKEPTTSDGIKHELHKNYPFGKLEVKG